MPKYPAPTPPFLGPAAHTSGFGNKPIDRIVIHSTVSACVPGGARQIAAYFRSPSAGGSAHYIVDPGEVVQSVYDDGIAWHAPPNQHSIGIEMCDMPDGKSAARWDDANHKAMLDRTAQLTAELCLAYDVSARFLTVDDLKAGRKGITTHNNVSQAFHQSTHWDPGAWPQDEFMRLVHKHIREITGAAGRKPAKTLRVVAWNAHNLRTVADGLEQMGADGFDLALIFEAAHIHDELALYAKRHGLTLLQETPVRWQPGKVVPERGDVAVLVGKGTKVRWSRVRPMREPWVAPVHGRDHEPRRYRRLRVKVNGQAWRVAVEHWPTAHPADNAKAVAETMTKAKRWLRRGKWTPSVLLGDLNAGAKKLNAWARPFGAQAHGHGPDNAVVRGCKADVNVLDKYGSDHHAIAYTFTKEK
jgi:endonuclease/exonuclease/phosphatase family metal-dependent hydrolase